ncbi:general (type II) secretion pathway protein D [Alcanivorax marinus]|nr:general (type II) secretion pathway protein D [Alloalcanivorax marinus]
MEATGDGKTWTVNIRNADIQAFINQVAQMTGKNFVVDPRVRARDVTVISNQPLTADEVYELFLSVLQVHGYAAVPAGNGVIKIVPNPPGR